MKHLYDAADAASGEQIDIDQIRAGIHDRDMERIAEQKEALTNSPELRRLLSDVAALRAGIAEDASSERCSTVTSDYDSFEGLRTDLRVVFDFRTMADGSYGERKDGEKNAKPFLGECNEELAARIYDVAEAFRLTGNSEPTEPMVKAAVTLGGAAKSAFDRTTYKKELLDAGKLVPEYLVWLGSDRKVDADEIKRAGEWAVGAQSELDLDIIAAEKVFGITVDRSNVVHWEDTDIDPTIKDQVPHINTMIRRPADGTYPEMIFLAAGVITNPYRETVVNGEKQLQLRPRANSEDTLALLGKIPGLLSPGDKAVAVTNAHFRPFQGAAAAGQLASYGIETEVVGFDPQHFGNPPKRSDELLQEMLTTANSLAKATAAGNERDNIMHRTFVTEQTGKAAVAQVMVETEEQAEVFAKKQATMELASKWSENWAKSYMHVDIAMKEGELLNLGKGFSNDPDTPENRRALQDKIDELKAKRQQIFGNSLHCYETLYNIDPKRVDPDNPASLKDFYEAGSALGRLSSRGEYVDQAITVVSDYLGILNDSKANTEMSSKNVERALNEYARATDVRWLTMGGEGFGLLRHVITYANFARGYRGRRHAEATIDRLSRSYADMRPFGHNGRATAVWLEELPKLLPEFEAINHALPGLVNRFLERYAAGEKLSGMNDVEEQYDQNGVLKSLG